MAAIIKQDVLEFAPELAKIRDPAWAIILVYANSWTADGVGGGEDGPLIRMLRILLAAHYAVISRRGLSGAAGPVTSEAAGAVRRSYGLVALASGDASFGATAYGQQFLGIVQVSLANGPRLL